MGKKQEGLGRNRRQWQALALGQETVAMKLMTIRSALLSLVTTLAAASAGSGSPFATQVIDYDPAPGQHVTNAAFDDAGLALGPPIGGGTAAAGNTSLVTLGGFGGFIILGFDHTILDDAANPWGMDAIVFGNSFWVAGDNNRHWAEAGIIEISQDTNSNGLADDAWYLIPGTHLTDPPAQIETQTWDDDFGDPANPPANPTWLPPGRSGLWMTSGFRLPSAIFEQPVVNNPFGPLATEEGIYGYADYNPTLVLGDSDGDNSVDDLTSDPEDFFTVPDDPFEAGVTAGSAGGDAFDIAWAIDPVTGQAANLAGFDFIRITTGINYIDPLFGEGSTDIDAAADAREGMMGDGNWDGVIDLADLIVYNSCLAPPGTDLTDLLCRVMDFDGDLDVDLADHASWQNSFQGP